MPSRLGCQNTALAPPPPPCSWGAGGLALAAQNAAGKPEEGGMGTWRGAALGGRMARTACMGSSLAGSPRVPTAARGRQRTTWAAGQDHPNNSVRGPAART